MAQTAKRVVHYCWGPNEQRGELVEQDAQRFRAAESRSERGVPSVLREHGPAFRDALVSPRMPALLPPGAPLPRSRTAWTRARSLTWLWMTWPPRRRAVAAGACAAGALPKAAAAAAAAAARQRPARTASTRTATRRGGPTWRACRCKNWLQHLTKSGAPAPPAPATPREPHARPRTPQRAQGERHQQRQNHRGAPPWPRGSVRLITPTQCNSAVR